MTLRFAFACSLAVRASAKPLTHADLFEIFVQEHSRNYASDDERTLRFGIFTENMKFIEETNAIQQSFTVGVTQFADMTFQEFLDEFVGGTIPYTRPLNATRFEKSAGLVLPNSIDWTTKGAVTEVKGQGHCGGCWAFSATGALEGAMAVAGHKLVSLSEQMLVSCDTGFTMMGCDGGNPEKAMSWVMSNGICSEEQEPFVCRDSNGQECKTHQCAKSNCTPVLKGGMLYSGDVSKVDWVGEKEEDLEAAVSKSPVSVQIQANSQVFQHYTGGVLTDDACGHSLDHSVVAVGYGVDGEQKYWKVKNSWNATWGESGFIRLARGKSTVFGECGIRESASIATVRPPKEILV
jgi:cathepsin L